MTLRSKFFFIIISVLLIFICVFGIVFGSYLSRQLEAQEDAQIRSISNNLYSYVTEQQIRYQKIAGDLAHSDEAYAFVMGDDTYIKSHLTAQTFKNLDLSFMVFSYHNDWIYLERQYDPETGTFRVFDSRIIEKINQLLSASGTHNEFSSIFSIGDDLYFIAASPVTDSQIQKTADGQLFLGQVLDPSVFETAGESKIVAIKPSSESVSNSDAPVLKKVIRNDTSMVFDCLIPGEMGKTAFAVTFEMTRGLYRSGMDDFTRLILLGAMLLVALPLIVFALYTLLIKKLRRTNAVPKQAGEHGAPDIAPVVAPSLPVSVAAELEALASNQHIYTVIQSVTDGIIIIRQDGIIQFINHSAQELTGLDKSAQGKTLDDLISFAHAGRNQTSTATVKDAFETKMATGPAEDTWHVLPNDKRLDVEYTVSPVLDKNESITAYVIMFRDFGKKKEKQEQMEYVGYHDPLTGLYNRRYLEEEINRLDIKRNLPISLIFADINGLKIVNDAFGHQSGDQLICKAAKVIRGVCRADEIIARAGGDEFIILLISTDKNAVEILAKRIMKKVEQYEIMGIGISLSCGWDTKTSDDQSIWDVLKSAEDLMYHNKIIMTPNVRSSLIRSVLKTLHIKSPVEKDHSQTVGELCEALGRAADMQEEEIRELRAAGWLHDIGKVAIDGELLNSTEALTESEWVQIRSHPEKGYRILNTSTGFYGIAEYVLMHHERWDGKGYPKGLSGEAIPKTARIIAIVDAYDSMTRSLPYRKAAPGWQAINELKKYAGSQFDPHLVQVFVEKVLKKEPNS